MHLTEAIQNWSRSMERCGFRTIRGEEAALRRLRERLPVHESLLAWYSLHAPDDFEIWIYGNPICFPHPDRLIEAQDGYRWNSQTGEHFDDWEPHFLVIADQGGDPFILDVRDGSVHFALHGAGSWKPVKLADDLGEFLTGIAAVCEIVIIGFDGVILDEDFLLRPEVKGELKRRLAEAVREDNLKAWTTWMFE